MVLLDIATYPDPVLREKCQEVESIDSEIQTLLENMIETVIYAQGVGLAAPQIGVPLRIIAFDGGDQKEHEISVLINPEIIEREGNTKDEEGCLSIPEIYAKVRRAEKITVKGLNRHGEELVLEETGRTALVLQHEIDHLDGVLFWDRIGKVKRDILKRKYNKKKIA